MNQLKALQEQRVKHVQQLTAQRCDFQNQLQKVRNQKEAVEKRASANRREADWAWALLAAAKRFFGSMKREAKGNRGVEKALWRLEEKVKHEEWYGTKDKGTGWCN